MHSAKMLQQVVYRVTTGISAVTMKVHSCKSHNPFTALRQVLLTARFLVGCCEKWILWRHVKRKFLSFQSFRNIFSVFSYRFTCGTHRLSTLGRWLAQTPRREAQVPSSAAACRQCLINVRHLCLSHFSHTATPAPSFHKHKVLIKNMTSIKTHYIMRQRCHKLH
jgi:hypothetical protein